MPRALRTATCAALAAASLAPACGGASPPSDVLLEEMEWTLVALDGAPLEDEPGGPAPSLQLSAAERRASGFAGCNRFMGSYEHTGDALRFGPLAATKMYCPRMALETAFLHALEATRRFRVTEGTLELLGAESDGGAVLARLRAAADRAPEP